MSDSAARSDAGAGVRLVATRWTRSSAPPAGRADGAGRPIWERLFEASRELGAASEPAS